MRSLVTGLLLILTLTSFSPLDTMKCHAADAVEKPDPSAVVNNRLDRVLADLKFDAVNLSDVLDFVGEATQVDFFVDWKRLEAAKVERTTPVTCNLQGRKFSAALQDILDAAAKGKMVFQVEGGVILISTKEGTGIIAETLNTLAARKFDAATRELLEKPLPEFVFDAISLGDAIDFFEKSTQAKLLVDWDALKKAGVARSTSVTMKQRHACLADALQLLFFSVLEKPVVLTAAEGGIRVAPAVLK
jgi:hypothetical protein